MKILCICTSMCSDGHKPFTANKLVHVQLHTIEMIDATYSGLTPPQIQTPTSALPSPPPYKPSGSSLFGKLPQTGSLVAVYCGLETSVIRMAKQTTCNNVNKHVQTSLSGGYHGRQAQGRGRELGTLSCQWWRRWDKAFVNRLKAERFNLQ